MLFHSSDPQDVRDLQQLLANLGFEIAVDGVFGPKTGEAVKAFQAQNFDGSGTPLLVDGIVGPATWASLQATAALAGSRDENTDASAGFDTAFYPGDARMLAWKQSSPYSFVGYYLAAPAHPNASWMGTRKKLLEMGWDLAVLYVGRQSQGPGSNRPPDATSGHQHGSDALSKAQSEGFLPGVVVYLDVEPMDHIPPNMIDYVNAWLSEFEGKAYLRGIYCHKKNAVELKTRTAQTGPDTLFWVSGSGSNFQPGVSRPTDSGIPFATIWQGAFNQVRTFGGVSLNIDENVASRPTERPATAGGIVT